MCCPDHSFQLAAATHLGGLCCFGLRTVAAAITARVRIAMATHHSFFHCDHHNAPTTPKMISRIRFDILSATSGPRTIAIRK